MTTDVPPLILLTRPRADSQRLARQLAVPCLISPLIEIVPRGVPPKAEAVIFTSRNGVTAWREGGGATRLPAWCVGPRTAELAREAGFDVRGVAPDVAALVASIPPDAPPLLHARGKDQRGNLVESLRARGLPASDVVLYAAESRPLSKDAIRAVSEGPLIVPLYSPRSANLLVSQLPKEALGNLRAIAISSAVAECLPIEPIAISVNPDGQSMLQSILDAIEG